jgi:hypothetical protein
MAMNSLKRALSMLCCISCQSKDRACYDCEKYWSASDARAAVKKKSDNNVVSEALQAKWMDDIKGQGARTIKRANASLKVSKRLVMHWPCTLF